MFTRQNPAPARFGCDSFDQRPDSRSHRDVYGSVYGSVLFPAWEGLIRGRPTLDILAELEESQHSAHAALVAGQLTALRALALHAKKHVPCYRERLAGVDVLGIRTLADLHAIPLLTRADARAAGDTRRSTAPPLPTITKATSGTSGDPLTFAYEPRSEHWRQAVKLRGYGWAGQRPGVKTMHFWGGGVAPARSWKTRTKIALDRALRREIYVDCGSRSDATFSRAASVLARKQPDVLVCFAQAGAELARWVIAKDARSWKDMSTIACAELLLDEDRAAMARAFGPGVFESYGSREFMLIAMECEAHDGMHVSMENVIVEIVVRENGRTRAARPGELGEIVITDLHNWGMPFIRYANGDLAVAREPGPCTCGRTLDRIGPVHGRVTETLRDREGGRVGGLAVCSVIAQLKGAVNAFQTVQHASGAVTVRLVPAPAFVPELAVHVEKSLSGYLKGHPVRVDLVRDIPASPSGKRPIIVVEPSSACEGSRS